jgi:hypothetical protein
MATNVGWRAGRMRSLTNLTHCSMVAIAALNSSISQQVSAKLLL